MASAVATLSFSSLKHEYEQERNLQLSDAEFELLLCLVPVLLIASGDFTLDRTEMQYLDNTIQELMQQAGIAAERIPTMAQVYHDEMEHLTGNLPAWDKRMLAVLRDRIREFPLLKEIIRARMVGVAEASGGVNPYEQKLIASLNKQLEL